MRIAALILLLAAVLAAAPTPPPEAKKPGKGSAWKKLESGLELGEFEAPLRASSGDSRIRVLRVDPKKFDLKLLSAAAPGEGTLLSARDWCRRHGLVAAINASMYQADFLSSVSLMKRPGYVNNPRLSKDNTVLAWDPRKPGLPPVRLIDRECDDFMALEPLYGSFVQSIRLITCKGKNVWQPQPRRASAALVGQDRSGRVLLIHVRSPYPVHDIGEMLLALPLKLAGVMYAEGGHEAQLFVSAGGVEREFTGSLDPALEDPKTQRKAATIPNAIGVARRSRDSRPPSPADGDAAKKARGSEN
jgi:hypothetical protein